MDLTSYGHSWAFTCHDFPESLPKREIGLKEIGVSIEVDASSLTIKTVRLVGDVEELNRNTL